MQVEFIEGALIILTFCLQFALRKYFVLSMILVAQLIAANFK